MSVFAGLVGGWLMPMVEERADTSLNGAVVIAILVVGYSLGVLMIRRSLDPGPLARGEARWRYRSRPHHERIGRARTWLAPSHRTPGWWATRVEFAIAITAAFVPLLLGPAMTAPNFDDTPPSTVLPLLGVAEASILVGLVWMVRIYRAPLRNDYKAFWR
jgi:hypothetical protein